MANVIKLKNASGSDPSASDLVVGEVALRTDTAKLFTKKDDNSVAEIGATVSNDAVDTNAIQDDAVTADKLASDAVVTNSIVNDAVTFAKQQNISTSRVLGRVTSSSGNVEELTAANIRTLINVEDGATADQSNSEIKTAYEANSDTNAFTDALLSKLNGIAASATNVTNTNQLTNGAGFITATLTEEQVEDFVGGMVTGNTETGITVTYQDSDGTLDFVVASQTENDFTTTLKNKLDGIAASATNVTNTNQLTNGAGYITATLTNEQVQDIVGGMVTGNTESGITVTYQDGDGTLDFSVASQTDNNFTNADHSKLDGIESGATADQTASEILTLIKTVDGSGSGLDADTLDGANASASAGNNTIVKRHSSGYIFANYFNTTANDVSSGVTKVMVETGNDNYIRHGSAAAIRTFINVADGANNITNNNQLTNGAGYITSANGGNAATLDSIDSSQFARSDTADTLSGLMTFSGGISLGADARCAAGISSLSDGSTITVNFTSGIHHNVTLGGNRTLSHSNTSSAIGQSGSIFISQDSTGSRTLSFNSAYKFAGGSAPTLSTAASSVDRIDYVIKAGNVIHCAFTADVK